MNSSNNSCSFTISVIPLVLLIVISSALCEHIMGPTEVALQGSSWSLMSLEIQGQSVPFPEGILPGQDAIKNSFDQHIAMVIHDMNKKKKDAIMRYYVGILEALQTYKFQVSYNIHTNKWAISQLQQQSTMSSSTSPEQKSYNIKFLQAFRTIKHVNFDEMSNVLTMSDTTGRHKLYWIQMKITKDSTQLNRTIQRLIREEHKKVGHYNNSNDDKSSQNDYTLSNSVRLDGKYKVWEEEPSLDVHPVAISSLEHSTLNSSNINLTTTLATNNTTTPTVAFSYSNNMRHTGH